MNNTIHQKGCPTKNIVGKKYNKLTVISNITPIWKTNRIRRRVRCLCDCGKYTNLFKESVTSGHTKSCGCLQVEKCKKTMTTHGLSGTPFSHCFSHILSRCNNSNTKQYKDYGGRGIKCEWKNLVEFHKDMFKNYQDHVKKFGISNTTIERIDNSKNYCKENCKWATRKEQSDNRRNNVFLLIDNKLLSVYNAAKKLGISKQALYSRKHRGWMKKCWMTTYAPVNTGEVSTF